MTCRRASAGSRRSKSSTVRVVRVIAEERLRHGVMQLTGQVRPLFGGGQVSCLASALRFETVGHGGRA